MGWDETFLVHYGNSLIWDKGGGGRRSEIRTVRIWLWLSIGTHTLGFAGDTDIVKNLCQRRILLCGREHMWYASIYLGCSQVVQKTKNSISKTNSIIQSIDATVIITYFNLRLRNEFLLSTDMSRAVQVSVF